MKNIMRLFIYFIVHATVEQSRALTGSIIQKKAKILSEISGEASVEFKASSGWLGKLINRYGEGQVCGEELSVKVDAEMDEFLKDHTKDQVFIADETGLNLKMLPKYLLYVKT